MPEQKSLVLILAREFASQLAMPTFIVDGGGSLVFYNEAAETIIGAIRDDVGFATQAFNDARRFPKIVQVNAISKPCPRRTIERSGWISVRVARPGGLGRVLPPADRGRAGFA